MRVYWITALDREVLNCNWALEHAKTDADREWFAPLIAAASKARDGATEPTASAVPTWALSTLRGRMAMALDPNASRGDSTDMEDACACLVLLNLMAGGAPMNPHAVIAKKGPVQTVEDAARVVGELTSTTARNVFRDIKRVRAGAWSATQVRALRVFHTSFILRSADACLNAALYSAVAARPPLDASLRLDDRIRDVVSALSAWRDTAARALKTPDVPDELSANARATAIAWRALSQELSATGVHAPMPPLVASFWLLDALSLLLAIGGAPPTH